MSVASGGDAPRLYFKKSTEADAFGGNTSAANGLKYVTAGNTSSPYDFTVHYALLTSSARGGDVIEYFVVAQDGAANFASSPSGASYSSTAAPVTTVNARPATVQSYRILSTDLSALTLSSGALAYTGSFGGPLLTDPITTGQQSTKVEPSATGVDFRGLFVRRKDAASAGLTYTPQFSADMTTWQSSVATPTVLADDGTNQIVSVPYPVFIAGKKARFFRINVTINP